MHQNAPETDEPSPNKPRKRQFLMGFSGQDDSGATHNSSFRYTTNSGKITFDDIDEALKKHCTWLRVMMGVPVYYDKGLITHIFEVDVE